MVSSYWRKKVSSQSSASFLGLPCSSEFFSVPACVPPCGRLSGRHLWRRCRSGYGLFFSSASAPLRPAKKAIGCELRRRTGLAMPNAPFGRHLSCTLCSRPVLLRRRLRPQPPLRRRLLLATLHFDTVLSFASLRQQIGPVLKLSGCPFPSYRQGRNHSLKGLSIVTQTVQILTISHLLTISAPTPV